MIRLTRNWIIAVGVLAAIFILPNGTSVPMGNDMTIERPPPEVDHVLSVLKSVRSDSKVPINAE